MGAPLTLTGSNNAQDDDPKKPQSASSNNDNLCSNNSTLPMYLTLIEQYLTMFMVDNATFLAERCVADYPGSQEATYMLALCYYRAGAPKRARQVLDKTLLLQQPLNPPPPPPPPLPGVTASSAATPLSSISCNNTTLTMRYLYAQCSFDLQEYGRAEEMLLKDCRIQYQRMPASRGGGDNANLSMDDWIVQTSPCPIPNGAAGLALLGKLCRKTIRKERAIKYFKMSLQLDPFLWTSFEALAELGADVNAVAVFGVGPPSGPHTLGYEHTTEVLENNVNTKTPLQPSTLMKSSFLYTHNNGSSVSNLQQHAAPSFVASNHLSSNRGNILHHHFETPGLTPIPVRNAGTPHIMIDTPQQFSSAVALPPQYPAVLRRARDVASRHYYPPSPQTPLTSVARSMRYLKGLGMYSNGTYANDTSSRMSIENNESGLLGGGRSLFLSMSENQAKNQPFATSASTVDELEPEKPERDSEKLHAILQMFSIYGSAYQRICNYQCRDALDLLQRLPQRQQMTGWVLHQQGRAFLELNDFNSAQRSLELMQVKDPGRMQGLELLSTVYWQLKNEFALANLSQHVVDLDRLRPEAWCVVGNCFSLQKDHESALVFFRRSLQLDNDFTYTHTLSGYEYMANEDFEKATACFRQAIRIDSRHYNAWYGLGAIAHRQEKFDVAEFHFGKAVLINPSSSVLRCNLGIAQHANGKSYQALDTLAGAFHLDPRNPQARFQRATIFSSLQRPEEALAELEKVRDVAPREATIYFAMGKVHKRLGQPEEAMKCFLTAMDLDPKDNQVIKSAMDKLDEPEIDEETLGAF